MKMTIRIITAAVGAAALITATVITVKAVCRRRCDADEQTEAENEQTQE